MGIYLLFLANHDYNCLLVFFIYLKLKLLTQYPTSKDEKIFIYLPNFFFYELSNTQNI